MHIRVSRVHGVVARASSVALLVVAALAVGAGHAAGQLRGPVRIMTHARTRNRPVNHGMPDRAYGFTFCRLRYDRVRRQRKRGWSDDYPASDYNFMQRLAELTTTRISRWANGDPGFMQVTIMDPELFRCPFLKMQNAADYDFTGPEVDRLREFFLKGGFLWEDDNWTEEDWDVIRGNLRRIFPTRPIVDIKPGNPVLTDLYRVTKIPQIPAIETWRRTGSADEFGAGPPHLYGIFGKDGSLMVLVSLNCDTSDSWEREGDNPNYFYSFASQGYGLGIDVALWVMTH